jgi:hypothetical protein
MNTYKYELDIQAKEKADADEKMKALIILSARLNARELAKLAHVVAHDPVKTRIAKAALGL